MQELLMFMYHLTPDPPVCPLCNHRCDTIYRDSDGVIVGCDCCLEAVDAWEVNECFPEKE